MKLSEDRTGVKTKIEENKEVAMSFVISAIAMYLFLLLAMKQSGVENTWITGDVIEQYIPALKSFTRNLFSGEGISYSWDLFLGMNATEFYTTYVGGSFTNILYLLFPFLGNEAFFILTLVIKGGLAGAGFVYFSKKVLSVEGYPAAFLGVFYALCGFQVTFGTVHYIWGDALYLLPLILAFQKEYLEEKNWGRLVLAYAYLFLCNFYMGYIVGIFSGLFFLFYCLWYGRIHLWKTEGSNGEKGKNNGFVEILQKCFIFGLLVILAVGMAAIALLPTIEFLLTKNPPDATSASKDLIQQDLLVLLSRFSFGLTWEQYLKLPYFYCGIPILILVPFFFVNKEIKVREKLLYGGLLFVMLLSCMVLPIYMFWHGFDAPDMWYCRFSFLISFVCVVMACRSYRTLSSLPKKTVLMYGGLELLLGGGIGLYCVFFKQVMSIQILAMNLGIGFVWMLLIFAVLFAKENLRRQLLVINMLLAVAEVVGNGCLQNQVITPTEEIEVWNLETQSALQLLQEDKGFYRINYENDFLYNSDTYWGYKGISDFWSYENYEVRCTLEKLGAYTSPRVLKSYGLNPFTQMVLGVKYNIQGSASSTVENAGARVNQYNRVLNLGFCVEEETAKLHLGEENVYENCNRLAGAMTGRLTEVFCPVPIEKISVKEAGILHGKQEDFYYLSGNPNNEEMNYIDFLVPSEEREAYITFQGHNTVLAADRPRIYNYYNTRDYGMFGVRYSKKMDPVEGKLTCSIVMQNGVTTNQATYRELQCYYADEDALEEMYLELKPNSLEVIDYKNGYVHGNVKVPTKKKLLFTTIPYDKGWSVQAYTKESEKVEVQVIPVLDKAFLGVLFPTAGEYEVKLSYHNPVLPWALGATLFSWGTFLTILLFGKFCKKKGSSHNNEG